MMTGTYIAGHTREEAEQRAQSTPFPDLPYRRVTRWQVNRYSTDPISYGLVARFIWLDRPELGEFGGEFHRFPS